MFGITTTRRMRAELAAAKAETDRQRRRAETAEGHTATAVFNRKQALRQLADADATNRRLSGRNLELGSRLSALTESDPEYAAQLEQQLATVRQELAETRKRADHLQRRLDDAVGLPAGRITDSRLWQPAHQKPKEDSA